MTRLLVTGSWEKIKLPIFICAKNLPLLPSVVTTTKKLSLPTVHFFCVFQDVYLLTLKASVTREVLFLSSFYHVLEFENNVDELFH